MNTETSKSDKTSDTSQDFHGAAVLDQEGKEVPITEGMVQEACKKLDKDLSNKAEDNK